MSQEDQAAILLVDDDKEYSRKFCEILRRRLGLDIDWIGEINQVRSVLNKRDYGLILLDLYFDTQPLGLNLLGELITEMNACQVVILTNSRDIPMAVKAIKLGAFDFLEKSTDLQRMEVTITNALKSFRIARENQALRDTIKSKYRIIGKNPAILTIKKTIKRIADAKAPVLITGDTGTGKELVARAIHAESKRVSEPFIAVNCATLPKDLFESELFGHERGAFTGASMQRKGKFELAGKGTIFLDEITEIPANLQAKLLRVLQEREFERVGGNRILPLNASVHAASNRDLAKAVEEGIVREDLYYRLNVLPINIPPLRERPEDIPELFYHYLQLSFADAGAHVPVVAQDVEQSLIDYDWPGNIRQLRNLTQQIAWLHDGGQISLDDILVHLPELGVAESKKQTFKEARESGERELLLSMLGKHHGNVNAVASELGESIWNIYKKMKKYGLSGSHDVV